MSSSSEESSELVEVGEDERGGDSDSGEGGEVPFAAFFFAVSEEGEEEGWPLLLLGLLT